MMTVGFIGLGTMGLEMVRNLLKAGFGVQVFDVVPAAVAAGVAAGAVAGGDMAAAVAGAEVVVTMLPDTPDVEAVLLGPGGLVHCLPAGRVVVDMSTVAPKAVRAMAAALAARGIALIDAPVSGGPQGAKAGTLTIMAGGDAAAFERVLPVLRGMGTTVNHVGGSGAGQAMKLCNQIAVGINLQAVCEAIAFGRAAGLDLMQMREVLLGGSAASWMLDRLGPAMVAGETGAGFRIDLMLKDLRLVAEEAWAMGLPLPGTALVTSQYVSAKAHGEGGNGNQALFRSYDRMCNQNVD